jgi:hypothetical protein
VIYFYEEIVNNESFCLTFPYMLLVLMYFQSFLVIFQWLLLANIEIMMNFTIAYYFHSSQSDGKKVNVFRMVFMLFSFLIFGVDCRII